MLLINEKVLKSLFYSRIGVNSIDLNLNDGLHMNKEKEKMNFILEDLFLAIVFIKSISCMNWFHLMEQLAMK